MKEPNFFIIGAPKCGTTAMAAYLSQHPQVFMSKPKEPHHYNTDHRHGSYKDRQRYLDLFSQAGKDHKIVGEASVWYLYSQNAVRNILRDYPHAKFLVMLRNPIEMAPSLYRQMVFSGYETAKTFQQAWNLQNSRREGRLIPPYCSEPSYILYQEACSLGAQFERLLSQIDENQIFTILHDEFKSNPAKIWADLLEFLNLSPEERQEFPVINAAKTRRSMAIKRLNDFYSGLRTRLGWKGLGTGFFDKLDGWNRKTISNTEVPADVVDAMKLAFKDDIFLLSELLGRDLSHWLHTNTSG